MTIPTATPKAPDTGWSARAIGFLVGTVVIAFGLILMFGFLASSKVTVPKGPIKAGYEPQVRSDLQSGGPYVIADPNNTRNHSFYFDVENNKVIAVPLAVPGRPNCNITWKHIKKGYGFVDCDGKVVNVDDLGRYPVSISKNASDAGALFVDVHNAQPSPNQVKAAAEKAAAEKLSDSTSTTTTTVPAATSTSAG
jgi:hypothetical protein